MHGHMNVCFLSFISRPTFIVIIIIIIIICMLHNIRALYSRVYCFCA